MNFCNPSRVKRNGAVFGSPRFFAPAARPGDPRLRAARIRRKAQGCPRRRAPGDPTGLLGPGARRKADQDAGLTYPMLCGIISGSLKEEMKQ